ncbi:fibronectin type III domain-containing protein [Candidatus Bathyarchaeota archaeon]|nr:fibronectin type III domain-containing protein [Candidatus Bathyarchaeota archaeon]
MISFTLSSSHDNPRITFTEKGMFIAAIDPEGNRRNFGFSHPGETMSPDTSLIFGGTLTPDQAGEWKIWPSYEILIKGSDELLSSTQEGPEEWHSCTLSASVRDLPDLTPTLLSVDPDGYAVGDEANFILTVENIGGADSIECYGMFFVGSSPETSFYIPGIDKGSSVQVPIPWVPFQQGVWDLTVFVDYWISVTESDEDNNIIEARTEITSADTTILEIVEGPTAVDIAHDSAVIVWETNKASDSRVEYGTSARKYSSEKTESTRTGHHSVQLTDLKPSSTYHFTVVSLDENGDRVLSKDQTFETPPVSDEVRPQVSLADPGIRQGITTIHAEAQDDEGIERVEFYLNDALVFTDYSPPYSFTVDSSAYENGVHRFTTTAYDTSGQSASQSKDVEFLNVKDSSTPTVDITFPKKDDKVSGKIQVTASLADDTGLGQVYFKVDGGFESFKGYPTHPKSDKVTFTLDTSTVSDGRHRLSVEVYDKEGKYGYDTVDVWVSQPPAPDPPKLKVKGHTITRYDNYFVVSLTVENVGGATATDVVVQDFLRSFQPISGDDVYAEYDAGFTSSTMYGDVAISSKMVIHSKQSVTYTYKAVPVLVHPVSDFASLTPSIGDPVKLWYEDPEGKEHYDEYALPVPITANGETIPSSYLKAIKTADYLIVTNPQRLSFYSSSEDVDDLLSTMAELARYRFGVLGYTTWKYAYYEQVLHGLIKDGGSWSSKLKDGWSSDGFLLIVGETEIIPSWNRVIGTFYTTAGDYTWKVVTDNPYANTFGDEKKPELNIARIIGANAKEFRKVIETSLNVLLGEPGYGFDRSKALLASGFPSNLMGGFDGQMNAVADTIKKKTPATTTDKINTPDFAQYNPSTGEINEGYTNTAVDNVFFGATKGRSIIFLAGHGNWDHWDKIDRIDVKQQTDPFGWSNPFIFASSCKTGIYSGVPGFAEAFLQKGAAVYLGATESGGWTPYSTKFFEVWDLNEPISQAVKQVKAGLGDGAEDKVWLNVYHVYGDAKFGAAQSPMQTVGYFPASTGPEAPSRIDVVVPNYELTQTGEENRITIPGGYESHETGYPIVPTFKVFYNYPKGCQIQDVALEYRSPPITVQGIDLPYYIIELPDTGFPLVPPEPENYEWWPDKDYEWDVSQSPEGTTLTITLYPLFYNPETHEAKFHQEYGFAVDYAISSVEITRVVTDKSVYETGEPVYVDIELENSGADVKDVVFEVFVTDESTGEAVDGLDLRTLRELKGKAAYSCTWGSTQFLPGNYNVVVELRDVEGVLLDTCIEGVTLGVSSAEVTSFTVEPERFQAGENVEISMVLQNSGDTGITGTAIIKVIDSEGYVIDEYNHEFTELLPAESVIAAHEWDTSGAPEGVYRVVCYALYGGGSTLPATKYIGVDDTPPNISPNNPLQGVAVKNLVNLQARVDDQSEVTHVAFSIRTKDESQGGFIDPGFESMTAEYLGGDCWQLPFETTQISDGSYLITINAVDAFGNVGEETVEFSVLNAPTLSILTQFSGVRLLVNEEECLTDSNGLVSFTTEAPSYTVEAQPVIEYSTESRALFMEWEDGTQSNPRTVSVSSDTTLMVRYRTQHLLTVISPHGDPCGGGWYDEGTEAVFSVTSRTGFIPQHVFTGWGGDSDASSHASQIVMDGPKTVTANWETNYINLYSVMGLLSMTALAVLIVKHVRK